MNRTSGWIYPRMMKIRTDDDQRAERRLSVYLYVVTNETCSYRYGSLRRLAAGVFYAHKIHHRGEAVVYCEILKHFSMSHIRRIEQMVIFFCEIILRTGSYIPLHPSVLRIPKQEFPSSRHLFPRRNLLPVRTGRFL